MEPWKKRGRTSGPSVVGGQVFFFSAAPAEAFRLPSPASARSGFNYAPLYWHDIAHPTSISSNLPGPRRSSQELRDGFPNPEDAHDSLLGLLYIEASFDAVRPVGSKEGRGLFIVSTFPELISLKGRGIKCWGFVGCRIRPGGLDGLVSSEEEAFPRWLSSQETLQPNAMAGDAPRT